MENDRNRQDAPEAPTPSPDKEKVPRDRFATLGEKLVEQQRRRQTGSIAVSVAYATGEVLATAMDDVGPEQPSLSTLIGYAKMVKDGAVATKDAAIAQGIRSAALHVEKRQRTAALHAEALDLAAKRRDGQDSGKVTEQADSPKAKAEPTRAPHRRDSGGPEI